MLTTFGNNNNNVVLFDAAVSEQPRRPNDNNNNNNNNDINRSYDLNHQNNVSGNGAPVVMTLSDSTFFDEQQRQQGRCRCTKRCIIIIVALLLAVVVSLAVDLPLVLTKNKQRDAAASSSSSSSPGDDDDTSDIDFNKRYAFIRSAVAPYSQSSSFVEPDSPQSQALQWLVYQDKTTRRHDMNMDDIVNDTTGTSAAKGNKQLAQRYALLVLYYACGGDAWNGDITQFEYQVDVSECHFTHPPTPHEGSSTPIVPQATAAAADANNDDAQEEEEGEQQEVATIACNDQGEIVHLSLRLQGLAGRVPDEIAALTRLTTLDLGHNALEGTIPSVLAQKLTNLGTLVFVVVVVVAFFVAHNMIIHAFFS
jgi:hypothetical protein